MLSKDMKHKYQSIDFNNNWIGSRLHKWSDRCIEIEAPNHDAIREIATLTDGKWVISKRGSEDE